MTYISGSTFINPNLYETTVSGLTAQEFLDIFNLKTNNSKPVGTTHAAMTFDAVWAIALALNRTVQKMDVLGTNIYKQLDLNALLRFSPSKHTTFG